MRRVDDVIQRIFRLGKKRNAIMERYELWDAFWSSSRYEVDSCEDFHTDGWKQYDTEQDAHYFGVWVNPTRLMILSYVEGDWYLKILSDAVAYNRAIREMNDFYEEGFEFKTIDSNGITVYRQDRSEFFIMFLPEGRKYGSRSNGGIC